jgi:hypothetical protein
METEKRHTIKISTKESAGPSVTLEISQPYPILPQGLSAKSKFISTSDANRLVEFFDSNPHLWQHTGFEKLRREQRYDLRKDENGNGTFPELDWIMERIHQQMNSDNDDDGDDAFASASASLYEAPNEVVVEERYPIAFIKGERSGRLSSATFENLPFLETSTCPCCTNSDINHNDNDNGDDKNQDVRSCSCYIAQINLLSKCIQFIDKPKQRRVECWDVESQRHKYNFIMEPNTLVVKKEEALWNWRSRLAAYSCKHEHQDSTCSLEENASESESSTNANIHATNNNNALNEEEDGANRIITIKFRHAVQLESLCSNEEEEKKENDENELMELLKGKPLEELLTIIVTTSPIKSNPSTEMLERTFETFHHGGWSFAFKCPKVIICDGCRVLGDSDASNRNQVSKRYCNAKQSLRNGIATNDQAENYEGFKIALTKICKDAEEDEDSPFHNTR